MTWKQISFKVARERTDRVEALLGEWGAIAITLSDPGGEPVLEPRPGASPLWQQVRVTALFPSTESAAAMRARLDSAMGEGVGAWREEMLADQAWERAWLKDFSPMRFGDGLWIVPTECEPPDPDAINLRFDPGLAFGTGTHPTTELCLQWLASAPPVGQRLIDYGCGSGVLAVAALRLGAAEVVGIDNDPQALRASRDNAERNAVSGRLELRDDSEATPAPAPLVVANILSGVLVQLASRLDRCVAGRGRLILSGLLEHQVEAVVEAFSPRFRFQEEIGRDGWVRLDGVALT